MLNDIHDQLRKRPAGYLEAEIDPITRTVRVALQTPDMQRSSGVKSFEEFREMLGHEDFMLQLFGPDYPKAVAQYLDILARAESGA